MADENRNITIAISADTGQAEQQFKSLQKLLNEFKMAYEGLARGKVQTVTFEGEKLSLEQLNKKIDETIGKITQLRSAMLSGTAQDTALDYQIKQMQEVEKLKEQQLKTEEATFDQYRKNFQTGLNSQKQLIESQVQTDVKKLETAERLSQANQQSTIKQALVQQEAEQKKFTQEQSHIESLGKQYDNLYKRVASYIESNTRITAQSFAKMKADMEALEMQMSSKGASPARQNPLSQFNTYEDYLKNFTPTYVSYATQLRNLNEQAGKLHQQWVNSGKSLKGYNDEMAKLSALASDLKVKMKDAPDLLGGTVQSQSYLGSFQQKLRSHFNWILAGTAIATAAAIPIELVSTITEIEKGMAGMEQVIEKPQHAIENLKKSIEELNNTELKKFADGLRPEDIDAHEQLNKVTKDFIDIASKYGESITDVIESGKLWGRAYKDLNIVQTMVGASSKLAVADAFDMITANRALESSVMQWGFEIRNNNDALLVSNRIIDSWTNLAHNYTVSAQTLATANERMASSAHLVGVSFDFAQALVSVMARKTQAEGAEIGNALKSIFASVHSAKAITELEKLGVSVYKVANDGSKEFRKVEDVLVDVMLKTQDTTANVEELFKGLAGGKWQWNKMGAIVDYQEFIKALNLSINSQGFTESQVATQLDTIYRKVAQLNAELNRLASGNGGLKELIKDSLDALINVVKFIDRIPAGTYNTLLLIGALRLLSMGFTAITASANMAAAKQALLNTAQAEGVVTTGALATAQRGLAASVAFLGGPLNAILTVMSLATIAYGAYSAATNEAANKTDAFAKQAEQINNQYQLQQAQLENINKNIPYIETLAGAWRTLNEQLKNTEDAEKQKKITEELGETQKTLGAILGKEAAQRLVDAGMTQEAVDIEKQAYEKTRDSIATSMDSIRRELAATTEATVKHCNAQIEAIRNEAVNFDAAADAIGEALGRIQKFMYQYYSSKSNFFGELGKGIDKEGNAVSGDSYIGNFEQVSEEAANTYKQQAEQAQAQANAIKQAAVQSYSKSALQALQSLPSASMPGGGTGGGDGTVTGKDKKKGKGGSGGVDPSISTENRMLRDGYTMAQKQMFHDAKLESEAYATSLEKLQNLQDTYGDSVGLVNQKLNVMMLHMISLKDEQHKYANEAEYLGTVLDQQVDQSSDLQQALEAMGINWSTATKDQKKNFRELNAEFMQNHQNIKTITDAMQKYEEKTADVTKQITKLTGEMQKIRGVQWSVGGIYSSVIEEMNTQESIDIANATNKIDPFNYLKLNEIKLNKLKEQQGIYTEQIIELEAKVNQAKQDGDFKSYENNYQLLQKTKQAYAQNTNEIKDLEYQKTAKVREGLSGVVHDLIVNGNSLKNIWKSLWSDLAREAIQRLFQIQGVQSSVLGSIFNLFGGGGAKTNFLFPSKVSISKPIVGNAIGSIGNKEELSWIREGNKREAIIPLEDHRERGVSLWLQSGKELGMFSGNSYAPYLKNPDLSNGQSVNVQVQRSQAHIEELQKNNSLMMEQNQMILELLTNGNSSSGGQVVVVNTPVSGSDIAKALQQNPEIITGLLRQQKSFNRW